MKLSVVIVNYKVKHYLEQCLDALYKALDGVAFEVFVVDNASGDDSVAFLRRDYPGVVYIESKSNLGFARANNMAFARCSGDYLLMLNPDTLVSRQAVTGCMDFLDTHAGAGAVTVKMVSASGKFHQESKRGFPSPRSAFFKLSGLSRVFPRSKFFGDYNLLYLDEDKVHEVDIFCGAFIMFRRSLLPKVGMLDPAFFMYGEDIDFSYRLAHDGGCKNYYLPFPIIHYKGESSRQDNLSYVNSFYGAMLIFYKKYYGSSSWPLRLLVKAGVYVHGVVHFVSLSLGKLFGRSSARPSSMARVVTVDFTEDDLRALSALVASDGFACEVVCNASYGAMISATASDARCDYVLFNRDTTSYDDMIGFIARHNACHAELGVFSRRRHSLVMFGNVMT